MQVSSSYEYSELILFLSLENISFFLPSKWSQKNEFRMSYAFSEATEEIFFKFYEHCYNVFDLCHSSSDFCLFSMFILVNVTHNNLKPWSTLYFFFYPIFPIFPFELENVCIQFIFNMKGNEHFKRMTFYRWQIEFTFCCCHASHIQSFFYYFEYDTLLGWYYDSKIMIFIFPKISVLVQHPIFMSFHHKYVDPNLTS